jgi:hypothetical protein
MDGFRDLIACLKLGFLHCDWVGTKNQIEVRMQRQVLVHEVAPFCLARLLAALLPLNIVSVVFAELHCARAPVSIF